MLIKRALLSGIVRPFVEEDILTHCTAAYDVSAINRTAKYERFVAYEAPAQNDTSAVHAYSKVECIYIARYIYIQQVA